MSQYNYIRVSLYGQFGDELRTAMRFPTPAPGVQPEKLTVFNPTKVLEQFNNARECYALWNTAAGCYYGLVTRNPLDPGSAAMLLSLLVPHGVILSGRQVISALGGLRKTLVEDSNYSDEAVIKVFHNAGLPEHVTPIAELRERENQMLLPVESQPKGTGYRIYANGHELDTILSFPYQEESRIYRRVLVVAATTSLKPDAKLAQLMSHIEREYWVECPQGVTAQPTYAAEGERVTLTFSKTGFNTCKQNITAGIPSPYAKIDGALIKVKTPAESGMSFTRRVKLNVLNAKGGAVHGYTISVNGRSINTMEPYIELTERDMTGGNKVQINVASNNFKPVKIEKDPSDMATAESIDIVLEPLETGILLRLDFGEGRLFEQHISLERNTPEYSQLHSGNFHGFRAYRITGQGMSEAYNVDVRSAAKPTAPTFDNISGNTTATSSNAAASGRKIPVFENISRTDSAPKPAKEELKPAKEENKQPKTEPKEPKIPDYGTVDDEPTPNNHKTGIIIGVVCSAILLVLALIFFLPTSTKTDEAEDPDIITAENIYVDNDGVNVETVAGPDAQPAAATTQPAEPAQAPAAPVADEIADLAYLNGNATWRASELKTDKYRALVTAIQNGDLEAVANHEYFATAGRATNSEAVKVAEMAWDAIGTPNEGGNRRALQKMEGKDVDIHALFLDLSRRRPSKPNPNPRPGK